MTNTTTPVPSVPTALPLRPGAWSLDPAHSTVAFAIRHLGISKVRGTFGVFDADLVVGESLATSSVAASVDLTSIDTGNPDRDAHVRSADLLDVERRPTMSFRSTAIETADDGWTLRGDLAIGDVTREIVFEVELGGIETFPLDGALHAGFEARGELRRKDYELRFGPADPVLGDVVRIEIDLQFVAPSEGAVRSQASGS
jgi:polyisoprenoid-binding protein YceI